MEFAFGIALGIGVGFVMKDIRRMKFSGERNAARHIDSLGKKATHHIDGLKKTKSHVADVKNKATQVHEDITGQIKGLDQ